MKFLTKIVKHRADIMCYAGIGGVIFATVAACKATLKAKEIKDKKEAELDAIEEKFKEDEEYTEEQATKEIKETYRKTYTEYGKLYFKPVLIGGLSIASIILSHKSLKKDNKALRSTNAALASAYAALDSGYREYRKRVADRFGEETEKEIAYGVKTIKEKTEEVDPETGKTKKVSREIKVDDGGITNPYAFYFDETCDQWTGDPSLDLATTLRIQNTLNDRLRIDKVVYLNDVRTEFGLDRTEVGQVVGWRYDPDNPNIDSYIDFNTFNAKREANRRFINGLEDVLIIDPNVDGIIIGTEDRLYSEDR